MTEQVIIEFIPDFTKLETGLDQVAKTGKVDVKAFTDLQKAIDTTATDTQGLIKQFKEVGNASIKMGKSVEDAFGAGIQDALDEAGVSVEEFENALKKASKPAVNVRKELLALKNEMARLKAEGKDTGKEFDALRDRAAKLGKSVQDTNKDIKAAGSDTRGLDNVVGSISALAGGYAAVQGAAALFGDENEDLQKTLVKVNSAMALATGLQQVMNALQKDGSLIKLADSVATGAQTAALKLYTFVTGGATVATRIFRAALIATGIGAIVVLVLSLVSAFAEHNEAVKDAKKEIEGLEAAYDALTTTVTNYYSRTADLADAQGRGDVEVLKIRLAGVRQLIKANDELEVKLRRIFRLNASKEASDALNKAIDDGNKLRNDLAIIEAQITGVIKKELEEREKARNEENEKRKKAEEKIQSELKKLYEEQIKYENWVGQQRRKINDDLHEAQLKDLARRRAAQKKFYENMLADFKKSRKDENDAWVALDKERQASMTKSSETEIARRKKQSDDEKAQRLSDVNQTIAVAEQLTNVFNMLAAAQSAKDRAMITSKRRELDELLRSGAITEKAANKRRVEIEMFERAAQQRAAQREKEAAVFQALLAIPKAFLNGLSIGGPSAPVFAAIFAGLAAAQAAIIIAQPIPKFYKGKKDRYEGPGDVADQGSEIVERNGRMFLYTKPTRTYLGATDKVYTNTETKKLLHNTNISTAIKPAAQERFDYNKLAKAIPVSNTVVNIEKDFISEAVANGLSKNKYFSKRYQFKK